MGRWHSIDLLAEVYSSSTPYHYTLNNPIAFTDVYGMAVSKDKNGNYSITGEDAVTYAINMGLVGNGGNTWADFYKSLDDAAAGSKKENKGNKVANRSESTDVYGSGDAKSTKGAPPTINHDISARSKYNDNLRKQGDLAMQQSVNHAINTDGVNVALGTLAVPGAIIGGAELYSLGVLSSSNLPGMTTEFVSQMIKNDFNIQKSVMNFNLTSAIPVGTIYGQAVNVLAGGFVETSNLQSGLQFHSIDAGTAARLITGTFTTYAGNSFGKVAGGTAVSSSYASYVQILTTYVQKIGE